MNLIGGLAYQDGIALYPRPDVVSGSPLELYGPQYPGGKILNGTAFTEPSTGQQGDFGRNVLRGFGASQADLAFQRQFHLTERMQLRFRGEFFNIFNHPNFGPPDNNITDALFGYSTATLASSLGSGGHQRRAQPALPNWRPALDSTGAQACILSDSQVASRRFTAIRSEKTKDRHHTKNRCRSKTGRREEVHPFWAHIWTVSGLLLD